MNNEEIFKEMKKPFKGVELSDLQIYGLLQKEYGSRFYSYNEKEQEYDFREMIVVEIRDNYSKVGTTIFTMNGSPPKGLAILRNGVLVIHKNNSLRRHSFRDVGLYTKNNDLSFIKHYNINSFEEKS